MNNSYVAYIGPFSFPEGGAAARRIYANCKTIQKLGMDVVVVSGQLGNEHEVDFDGIKVVSTNERKHENLPVYLKHALYFTAGKGAIDWLDSQEDKPEAIILYSGYSPYLFKLIPWCNKNRVKIIFDAVEWYDAPTKIKQFTTPYYLNIELAMRWLIKKCDSVIAISSYLESYYSSCVNTVRIPPLINSSTIEYREECDYGGDKLTTLVYAGSPGRKDAIDIIAEAVLEMADEGYPIKLNLVGVTLEQLIAYPALSNIPIDKIRNSINCHGFVEHSKSIEIVKDSDYSVIIRPDIRSVKAGFPSKFVESLALGTPVIANISSDLEDYIQDGVNSFISLGNSKSHLMDVLKKSCMLSKNDRSNMRRSARELAVNNFDSSCFEQEMSLILK